MGFILGQNLVESEDLFDTDDEIDNVERNSIEIEDGVPCELP